MSDFKLWRMVIALVVLAGIFAYSLVRHSNPKNRFINVKFLARSGIFAAISIILYIIPFFNLSLPFFPAFLNIHFDEVPALIAGFAYGPWSAIFVLVVKTLAKLPMTSTLGVGELSDLIYSLAFILPATIVYRKKRTIKWALLGLLIGMGFQLVVSGFATTFIILDFYIYVMGWSEAMLLAICQAANPAITSLRWHYFWLVSMPFNLLKDALVVILTFLLYKRLHHLIDRIGAQKN